MPNHTATILNIFGPQEDIKSFIKLVDKGNDNHFDFNGIIPMPKELIGTSSPVRIQTQEEIDKIWTRFNDLPNEDWEKKQGIPFGLGITQEKHDELIKKYGYADWHSWSINVWGTKWGAYDASEWTVFDGVATINYQTAWSPADAFFEKASIKFPTLTFKQKFADEGGGFLGYNEYQNGKLLNSVNYEWDSEEGIALRRELGVYYDDE